MKYIDQYLELKKKSSHGTYSNIKHILKSFEKSTKKEIDEIGVYDIIAYLQELDTRDIKYSTKSSYRSYLNNFFEYVQEMSLLEGKKRINPVPSDRIFDFTKDQHDITHQNRDSDLVLQKDQLQKILDYIITRKYERNQAYIRSRDYLLFALAITTGARISELRTIQTKHINFEKCYFETGYISGARKTTLHTQEALLFFFPERLKSLLEDFIEIYCDKWVFEGEKKTSLTHAQAWRLLKDLREEMGFYFRWHMFRHSLISYRKIELNCPSHISNALMNHVQRETEDAFYVHLSIEDLKGYYEKYDPYKNLKFNYKIHVKKNE